MQLLILILLMTTSTSTLAHTAFVEHTIDLIETYHDAINKRHADDGLIFELPEDLEEGDKLLLFVATSGGIPKTLPDGFEEVIHMVKDQGDLALRVSIKNFDRDDQMVFIPKEARNNMVTLLVLRGVRSIVEARGAINTAGGKKGLAYAPGVYADRSGVVIAAYAYDDPHTAKVDGLQTIVSERHGDDGFALGIAVAGTSKRHPPIKASSSTAKKGGGDDIAVTISLD